MYAQTYLILGLHARWVYLRIPPLWWCWSNQGRQKLKWWCTSGSYSEESPHLLPMGGQTGVWELGMRVFLTYASVTVRSPQREVLSEWDKNTRRVAGQMLKTCVCLHSMSVCESVHMCAARKLSVTDGMLLDRLKLILAISGTGVNTGWTPTEPRQAKQAEDRWNHTL